MPQTNDISDEYMLHIDEARYDAGSSELDQWLAGERTAAALPVSDESKDIQGMSLDPFPTDRRPPKNPSALGTVARSVGEVPRQVLGGIDDAVNHAVQAIPYVTELESWLNENVANLRYDPVSDPKTATGSITRSLSEFITGFVPAVRGLKSVGVTNKVANPLLAGAIADFTVKNPQEARLADIWKRFDLPENILTEALSSKADDTPAWARFKNAVEGMALGGAIETGLILGARVIRSSKAVAKAQNAETDYLKARYGENVSSLSDNDLTKYLGDASRPAVESIDKKTLVAAKKIAKATKDAEGAQIDLVGGRGVIDAGDMSIFVNFGKINAPDDVKAVIAEVTEKMKPQIEAARRGTVKRAKTAEEAAQGLADDFGGTVTEILNRPKGAVWTDREVMAARMVLESTADKLLETARAAAAPNAGALDKFAFRRMQGVFAAINAEVRGASAESSRALAAWGQKLPRGGIEKARAIDQMMETMGGTREATEMAERLVLLADSGAPRAALTKVIEKGATATTWEAFKETWVAGLLWNPTTHVVNTMSSVVVSAQSIYERAAAAGIGAIRGTENGVHIGESLALLHGYLSSTKDMFRLGYISAKEAAKQEGIGGKLAGFSENFKKGIDEVGAVNKFDIPMNRAFSSEAFGVQHSTGFGKTIDFVGETLRLPYTFLKGADDVAKTIIYRSELHARALRQASVEGLTGEALGRRMAQLVNDPPENLRIAATDMALLNTFQNKTGNIGRAFLDLREKIPASVLAIPFVKTPVNIARYNFERTPLAPLVGQWRADLAAGGARADLALAKISTGSTIMAMALDWADSGLISGIGPGQKDKGEREAMIRQGWKPYAINSGGRWTQYSRESAIGTLLGFSADISEALRKGELDQEDVDEWQEVAAMVLAVTSQVTINKTYMRGISELTTMLADPDRRGASYVTNLISSFTPLYSLTGATEKLVDPIVRDANSPIQAIQARIMFLSDNLPASTTLWGKEISASSGLGKAYDAFSPFASSKIEPTAIDTEIMRLSHKTISDNIEDAGGPQKIAKRNVFDGVRVNMKQWPDVYSEYVKLSGNELKDPAWGLGAEDYLNAVVSGNHPMSAVYKSFDKFKGADAMKMRFIKETISSYRKQAQRAIMADPKFTEFARYVSMLKNDKQERSMPVE